MLYPHTRICWSWKMTASTILTWLVKVLRGSIVHSNPTSMERARAIWKEWRNWGRQCNPTSLLRTIWYYCCSGITVETMRFTTWYINYTTSILLCFLIIMFLGQNVCSRDVSGSSRELRMIPWMQQFRLSELSSYSAVQVGARQCTLMVVHALSA
jgi:hypothetical protein